MDNSSDRLSNVILKEVQKVFLEGTAELFTEGKKNLFLSIKNPQNCMDNKRTSHRKLAALLTEAL